MSASVPATFTKRERMVSRKLMETLFAKGSSRSLSVFPLRVVYRLVEPDEKKDSVQVLISVSKRHFKRAVKRNRVKRQIREAYRLNKQILLEPLAEQEGKAIGMAFIWQADELFDSVVVATSVRKLLTRMSETICKQYAGNKVDME